MYLWALIDLCSSNLRLKLPDTVCKDCKLLLLQACCPLPATSAPSQLERSPPQQTNKIKQKPKIMVLLNEEITKVVLHKSNMASSTWTLKLKKPDMDWDGQFCAPTNTLLQMFAKLPCLYNQTCVGRVMARTKVSASFSVLFYLLLACLQCLLISFSRMNSLRLDLEFKYKSMLNPIRNVTFKNEIQCRNQLVVIPTALYRSSVRKLRYGQSHFNLLSAKYRVPMFIYHNSLCLQ